MKTQAHWVGSDLRFLVGMLGVLKAGGSYLGLTFAHGVFWAQFSVDDAYFGRQFANRMSPYRYESKPLCLRPGKLAVSH